MTRRNEDPLARLRSIRARVAGANLRELLPARVGEPAATALLKSLADLTTANAADAPKLCATAERLLYATAEMCELLAGSRVPLVRSLEALAALVEDCREYLNPPTKRPLLIDDDDLTDKGGEGMNNESATTLTADKREMLEALDILRAVQSDATWTKREQRAYETFVHAKIKLDHDKSMQLVYAIADAVNTEREAGAAAFEPEHAAAIRTAVDDLKAQILADGKPKAAAPVVASVSVLPKPAVMAPPKPAIATPTTEDLRQMASDPSAAKKIATYIEARRRVDPRYSLGVLWNETRTGKPAPPAPDPPPDPALQIDDLKRSAVDAQASQRVARYIQHKRRLDPNYTINTLRDEISALAAKQEQKR